MDAKKSIDIDKIEGIAPLLQVFDMPASIRFYRDIMEFTVSESSGDGDDVDWVMLKLNGTMMMLNNAYEKSDRPDTPDQSRIKGHEDITLYFGYPDIDAFYDHLNEKGLSLKKPSVTSYGWKALLLKDPDNYNLVFHWPINGNVV